MTTESAAPRRRLHAAAGARILVAGLAASATVTLVGAMAESAPPPPPEAPVPAPSSVRLVHLTRPQVQVASAVPITSSHGS